MLSAGWNLKAVEQARPQGFSPKSCFLSSLDEILIHQLDAVGQVDFGPPAQGEEP
jgi:hypothetical protein